jgi:hypothetical protein
MLYEVGKELGLPKDGIIMKKLNGMIQGYRSFGREG